MPRPLPRSRRLLPVLLALVVLAGCRAPRPAEGSSGAGASSPPADTELRLEVDGAPRLGVVPLSIVVLEDGAGVSGAEVEVTGTMTHAGMIPVIVTATETEPGLYRAERFEFTMAGDWIITAEVELADGRRLSGDLEATVPGR